MIHFREPLQKEAEIDTVEYEASSLRQLGGKHTDSSQPPSLLIHPSLLFVRLEQHMFVKSSGLL